jgi:adenosylcobinamide kinase/adenosylcobinamide-phosphate guanylyltransferase
MEKILILGGCRSGKSSWAKTHAEKNYAAGLFVATAIACDDEMRDRIEQHRRERSRFWETAEIPFDLPAFLTSPKIRDRVVLVDCLTVWLSNILVERGHDAARTASEKLVESVNSCNLPLLLVANEVGLGIVPNYVLGRQFRDLAGFLNQKIASIADQVMFLTAGIATRIK